MLRTELHRVVGERYLLEQDLGPSSVGRSFLARDQQTGALVNLRLVDDETGGDAVAFGRLGREIAASFLVVHPNTIEVIDYGETPRERYLVSEHLDATSLREILDRSGPLDPERVAQIGGQVASALAAAHQEGIVHRGLSPSAVVRLNDAEGDVIKVRDFGLAKLDDGQDLTRTGVRVGHTAYQPPEYVESGTFTPRGDLYALGCLMSELLVGEAGVTTAEGLRARVSAAPEALIQLVGDLLQPDPKDRPGINAVIQRLKVHEWALSASLGAPVGPPSTTSGRTLFLLLAATMFGFVLGLALVTFAMVLTLPT